MRPNPHPARPAFTLVEILVVIAILGILASLAAWGTFAMIGNTQANTTRSTIRVVNKMLQTRWAAVVADAKKEDPSPQVKLLAGGPMGLDPTGARARVIWIKVRLAEAFPVSYQEIRPPVPPAQTLVYTYIPANRRKPHFAKYQQIVSALPGGTPGESSACLLMALNTLKAGDVAIDDQIKYAVKDTDSDGVPELVDGWNMPLAFFRFPWNNPALQAANPGAGNPRTAQFADPTDSDGTLMNARWYTYAPPPPPSLRSMFESSFHPIGPAPAGAGSPANAYYVAPVVVSAGRDQKMTLAADLSSVGAFDTDNVFSFQVGTGD